MKKAISSIDLTRFILAYFVLVIHFRPFLDISETLDLILSHGVSRLAVPFYLMSAGYFLNLDKIFETIKHYLKLYLKWSLIYTPIIIFSFIYSDASFLENFLILLRDIFFQGTVIHLWYLPHSALALFLFYLLQKRFKFKTILMFAFTLYTVGTFADAYSSFISDTSIFYSLQQAYLTIFVSSRNGLFFALFYVSLGFYFKEIKLLSLTKAIIGFILSFGAMLFELMVIIGPSHPVDYNFYFSLIFEMFFLFQIVLNVHLKERAIYIHLRQLASNIYFSHMLIFYVAMFIFGNYAFSLNHTQRFLLAALLTSLICGIIEAVKAKKLKQ